MTSNEYMLKLIHELLKNEELIEELMNQTDSLEFQKNRALLRMLNHFQNKINLKKRSSKVVSLKI